jgi:hypothetical protein
VLLAPFVVFFPLSFDGREPTRGRAEAVTEVRSIFPDRAAPFLAPFFSISPDRAAPFLAPFLMSACDLLALRAAFAAVPARFDRPRIASFPRAFGLVDARRFLGTRITSTR